MSWIRLTSHRNGYESAVRCEKLKDAILDRVDDYTVIVFDRRTMKVRETIDEIIAKLEGNGNDGWIENTGRQPCADHRLIAVLFADGKVSEGEAFLWTWEIGTEFSVIKYKFK